MIQNKICLHSFVFKQLSAILESNPHLTIQLYVLSAQDVLVKIVQKKSLLVSFLLSTCL